MKRTIEILLRLVAPPARLVALLLAAGATSSAAWADAPSLLNYMSFDSTDEHGIVVQNDVGTIAPTSIGSGTYFNYDTNVEAKFGANEFKSVAGGGIIGLQNNTSGLVADTAGWAISFWFHPSSTANWRSFFGFGLLNGDNYFFVKNASNAFNIYKDTTSTADNALGTPPLGAVAYTAASWNHIAIVCAAGGGTATLYVNGTSCGSLTIASGTSLREVLLCNGRWHSGTDSDFYRDTQTALFDDFALFGGALTPSAVKTIAMGADTALGLYNAGELNFSRSINVNFYYLYGGSTPYTAVSLGNNGTATVNSSSEGYGQYAVEGTYWSDVLATSTAAQSVKVFDGSATSDSTVTATVSGANGGGFTQSGFDHHLMSGYIGDSSSKLEPTVTFANIPFANYRVVLYFAVSDGSASKKYGYVTLNDTINVAGNGSTTIYGDGGATGWGGAAVSADNKQKNNILLGQNTLVSPVIANNASGSLKVKSHALYSGNTATSYYAGLAAIQIVEVTPNTTTGTYTFSPAADTTTAITSSSNWDNLPTGKGEDITISISGDATVNVDRDMAFGTITIASTSESAATLTFAGSCLINATQVNVPANVTVKYASSVSGGAPIINAPVVLNDATAALEIAAPATMANAISGTGKVAVSANAVVFTAENTFSGGLTIKSGGIAKTTVPKGFGGTGTNPQVGYVTVEDGGAVDVNKAYGAAIYHLTLVGTGVDGCGAAFNSGIDIGIGERQVSSITLTGDAKVICNSTWGLITSSHEATTLSLGSYKLTIAGNSAKTFWFVNTTVSGTGSIEVDNGGSITTSKNASTVGNDVSLVVKDGGALKVTEHNLTAKTITCEAGGTVEVSSNRTLNIQNGGTFTVNGTANISGQTNIGQTGSAGSHLVVGGTVNVNGSGVIKLVSTSDITKNGNGVINIAANAQVWWIDCSWTTSNAGDIFRGDGTLSLDGNGGNWSYYPNPCAFPGTLKVVTRNGTSDYHAYYAYFSGDPSGFTARPTLLLACGTEAAPGSVQLGSPALGKTMSVRDLSGHAVIYPWSSQNGTFTMDTLQERDTSFNGIFVQYAANQGISALTVRGETEATQTHSLTLTKASTTTGAATVRDNAKLIFDSTGSWENGTVTVADGGYLEVNNSGSVASTLDLQSGGTIVIQTVTTTSGEGDAATTMTRIVPISAGTVTFPDSGEAVIDISAIPDLASDESEAIINAATSLDLDVSKIRLVGKPYSLTRDGNALKVVNDGGLVWDSAKGWGEKDATKYDEATITSPGTVALGGTSLSFDTLTLTGSGTVSFSQTGDETLTVNSLSIASGVTLTAFSGLNLDGATVSMAGTSAYDTSAMIVVPDGVTLAMDGTTVNGNGYTRIIVQSGGTLELTGVTCTAKIYAQNGANVKTYGNCVLNSTAWHLFEYGSTLTVESGNTQLQAEGQGNGLRGKIIVKAGATFTNTNTDALKYSASVSEKTEVELWGTLAMGSSRWTLGENNLITLHEGSEITGAGENANNGALDWYGSGTLTAVGNAEIKARIKVRSGISPTFNVSDGKVLTLSTYDFATSFAGSITKAGDGMLKLNKIGLPVLHGSEGTVLSYNDSTSHVNHSAASVTFTGKIDFVSEGRHGHLIKNNFSLAENSRPQLAINTKKADVAYNDSFGYLFFETGWNDKTLAVRDLVGEGRVCMKASGGTAQTTTIETMQTQDTKFSGIFICNDATNEKAHLANLSVIGDGSGTMHSLTLSGANTSIGQLSVNGNAKVIFADNGSVKGSWAAGSVSVGATGFIQSESTASSLAATLTLQDGATVVRGSQPVKATALTALDSAATIKIAFADDVTPTDGMVVLSGNWATQPDAARFAFARSRYSGVYEFVVTDSGVVINEIETSVTVGGTEISVGNSWLLAAMQKSFDSGVSPTDMSVATVYLANNGLNGMPRAVSYLLGLENPDDATTAFVVETASVSSGEGNTPVLTFTGKSYSTDRATVTYSLYGGDSPNNMSEVTPDSNSGNVITVTVPSNATVKYYQLKMTVTPK